MEATARGIQRSIYSPTSSSGGILGRNRSLQVFLASGPLGASVLAQGQTVMIKVAVKTSGTPQGAIVAKIL